MRRSRLIPSLLTTASIRAADTWCGAQRRTRSRDALANPPELARPQRRSDRVKHGVVFTAAIFFPPHLRWSGSVPVSYLARTLEWLAYTKLSLTQRIPVGRGIDDASVIYMSIVCKVRAWLARCTSLRVAGLPFLLCLRPLDSQP